MTSPDSVPHMRTVDELVRYRARETPNHVAVIFSRDGDEVREYTSAQIDSYAYAAAHHYWKNHGLEPRTSSSQPAEIVGISGVGDFDYLISVLAIAKLGHSSLFLSPRLADQVRDKLLNDASARMLLIQQPGIESSGPQVNGHATPTPIANVPGPEVYETPSALPNGVNGETASTNLTHGLDLDQEGKSIAWILHSSGSTSLPRLVRLKNSIVLPRFTVEIETFGLDTLTTVPLYHAFGMSSFFRSFSACKTIRLYSKLPIVASDLIKTTKTRRFGLFSTVPFTLKLLSETREGMEFLKGFDVITSGGSPISEELGNELVSQGVRLMSVYGSSETGILLTSARPADDNEWNWLRLPRRFGKYLDFESRGGGMYELVCPPAWPLGADTNREDGSWMTKDLFIKHDTLEDAYQYVGRLDDVVVLENGEKVNPIGAENEIANSPLVDSCAIFGSGRSALGVVVVPSGATASMGERELRSALWSTVQTAQETLPAYAKISEEMVLVLPVGSPVPKTDKATVIRAKFLDAYKGDIENLYDEKSGDAVMTSFSEDELLEFLETQLRTAMRLPEEKPVSRDQDFGALGIDSLQATRLRSAIIKHVDLRGGSLGLNVVLEHPTLRLLATEILRARSGDQAADIDTADEEEAAAMINKYSTFNVSSEILRPGACIVLTGATGSLGAHILAKLCSLPTVTKIYCLVRASSNTQAHERVEKSLQARRLDLNKEDAGRKIVCLASDLSDAALGLGEGLLGSIGSAVDAVYHCGWTVNFNQRLRSFERDCIAGVHHLVSLCARRTSPARFVFFSSIGTVLSGEHEGPIPEAVPSSFSHSRPTGYARSKFVAEHICASAAASAGVPVGILRIGQIVGDSVHGVWNTSEASPLMLRSAKALGALPALAEEIRWLPVDTVAQISIELGASPALLTSRAPVFNVVNPHALHWTDDLLKLLAAAGLEFRTVPPAEWLALLEDSEADVDVNPTRKLLDYYRDQVKPKEGKGPAWESSMAAAMSSTFREVGAPSGDLIKLMVGYFKENW